MNPVQRNSNKTLFIHCPFDEKEEAKTLGAKWNSNEKLWYAPDEDSYGKLKKWHKKRALPLKKPYHRETSQKAPSNGTISASRNPHMPNWWFGPQAPLHASKEEVDNVVNYVTNDLREIAYCTRQKRVVPKDSRSHIWKLKWETLEYNMTNLKREWELTGETEKQYRARQACGSSYKGVWGGVPSVEQFRKMEMGFPIMSTAYDTRGD